MRQLIMLVVQVSLMWLIQEPLHWTFRKILRVKVEQRFEIKWGWVLCANVVFCGVALRIGAGKQAIGHILYIVVSSALAFYSARFADRFFREMEAIQRREAQERFEEDARIKRRRLPPPPARPPANDPPAS